MAIGRTRACSSPSNVTSALVSAATAGTKRITVPASPQSIVAELAWSRAAGVIVQTMPSRSIVAPSAISASAISVVSRDLSGRVSSDGPSPSAARMSARLVCDFDPGTSTSPTTGVSR